MSRAFRCPLWELPSCFLRGAERRILFCMTTLLDRAVEAARNLSPEMQDEIARLVLKIAAGEEAPVTLTTEERAAIAASRAAAERGEFATDNEVRAAWAKHDL
jgi:predicted transcriptional regulator